MSFMFGCHNGCTNRLLKNNKAPDKQRHYVFCLAVRTGLEPATLGVTGRYSNQLNYRTRILSRCKSNRIFIYDK